MKKTHRAALSILLVLTLLTALPLTALAETPDYNEPGQTTSVEKGETLTTNEGHVDTNAGTITTNQVVDGSPKPRVDAGYIENNIGTVTNNVNGGYIENNQKGAVVVTNSGSGTVAVTDEKGDIVSEGDAPKTVEAVSTVENNYGTVKENHSGNQHANREAGIVTNYGLVEKNYRSGVVGKNAQGGTVQTNYGWVGYNNYDDGARVEGVGNAGEVTNNYGLVFNEGGTVVNNYAQAADGGPAIVDNYSGTVIYNSGQVNNDSNGTVVENRADGSVNNYSGTVTNNYGYVAGGTVETNNVGGVVFDGVNYSKNENNTWVPDKLVDSTVETNYGTHVTFDNLENYFADKGTVNYGVHAMDGDKMVYLGQYKGAMNGDDSPEEVTIEKLQANCKGYKIIGILAVEDYIVNEETQKGSFITRGEAAEQTADSEEAAPGTTPMTRFKISAPTRLTLLWEKIASIFTPAASTASSSGGGEVVELSAKKNYIGIGSVIYINEKGYKVVEIKDDAYVVVSFDALSDEDVKDLDALFDSLFTPEQQALIKNVGQLLDAEDVLTVFGKPGNHPVFEVNKSLVQ